MEEVAPVLIASKELFTAFVVLGLVGLLGMTLLVIAIFAKELRAGEVW